MSRHRYVRNMNLDDELDDGGFSDEYDDDTQDQVVYEGITEDQLDQLYAGLDSIRDSIPDSTSSDREVKDALWYFYFDVEKSLNWILGTAQLLAEESSRRADAQRKKKEKGEFSSLPLDPHPSNYPTLHLDEAPLSALKRLAIARQSKSQPSSYQRQHILFTGRGRARVPLPFDVEKAIHVKPDREVSMVSENVAEQQRSPTSPTAPSKPMSKLAAMAATRRQQQQPHQPQQPSTPTTSKPHSHTSDASTKPLSKLQSKVLQARAAPPPDQPPPPPRELTQAEKLFIELDTTIEKNTPSEIGNVIIKATSKPHEHHLASEANLWISQKGAFDGPSPDDVVLLARKGTALDKQNRTSKPNSKASTPAPGTPRKEFANLSKDVSNLKISANSTPAPSRPSTPQIQESKKLIPRRELVEKVQKTLTSDISLCVVGHVDAGKSTLLGRLLVELGEMTDREHEKNARNSDKQGKSSFAYAWAMDDLVEERERGVTLDYAVTSLRTKDRLLHIVDTPGHSHLVHNMISGAQQADAALLIIDARHGEFEKGFSERGQTREHALLVRSLGVRELGVVVNKIDATGYSQQRFDFITDSLRPFLIKNGFNKDRIQFVPCAAMTGENVTKRSNESLCGWYKGLTVAQVLDHLEPPQRPLEAGLRLPVHNIFKGQTAIASGVGVTGRLCAGVVQVGEKVRCMPGDEHAIVKMIEVDEEPVPYAAAGTNVTLYLANIDPIHLSIGSVLCSPTDLVPLATRFVAQILLFDTHIPILPGTTFEMFLHSINTSASVTKLIETVDKNTGAVIRSKPRLRVLSGNTAARVEMAVGSSSLTSQSGSGMPSSNLIAIEKFSSNKDMGRILLRHEGETIAAGIIIDHIR
ncbi:hypothetical protein E3P78_00705 [Wallemia ichthyophaga]|nr:hypothetical protein E3P78_00705 [Wallemia ichthyophaga]